ncbi:lactoperoxidase-like [Macrosteles quadrilineatus]|uniref:lactoperoxidase-like n=1 Tax=Macrosteles quadrilineatus TaxID=74068 RepID=UPI0023E25F6F|nr:lactoperoxidase-like [Macrosteles quadrilineatus]
MWCLGVLSLLFCWDRVVSQNSECAVTLEATGRIEGRALCLRYADINNAFAKARATVCLAAPAREPISDPALGQLGTALQETTRILASRFNLNGIEVEAALPRIDTSYTDIWDYCPRYLRRPQACRPQRYRRHDALCNNLENPTWGAARTPFRRLVPPEYGDGISSPRVGSDDFPLPPPRHVSARVHKDVSQRHEHGVSFMFVAWGQLVDHDLTLTAETKDPVTRRDPDCCHGGHVDPNCMPLEVPPHDPFYSHYHQRCLNMLRSVAGVRPGCRLGSRVQVNSLTSFIDANFVYGSSYKVADSLRSLHGGLLRTVPVFDDLGLQPLLPPKTHQPDDGCIRPTPDDYCFLAGDNRVNEQLALGVLHTMFVREHNRIAKQLSKINPQWDDETLYQEARHIVAAMVQHITFSEFLPLLLGESTIRRYGLTLRQQGYSDDYSPQVDASVPAAFATAAFRFGHSLLPRALERWSPSHQYVGARRLSAMLQQPWDLYKPGAYDQYILGMTNQLAQAMDDSITEEVTNHLFQEPAQGWGRDLAAINVARAREHGVPGFNRFRRLCRLPDMFSWSDMIHHMSNVTVTHYHEMFSHPDDVDLWSAGVAEKPQRGSMVGPTFNCLIAMTFRDLKRGDRFWYENGGWPSSFTLEQLDEIRKVRLSRLVCDNSDTVETIQLKAMEIPDFDRNPRVPCNSKALPRINLWLWRDPQLEEDFEPSNNKETVIIEETHNLESPPEDNEEESNRITTTTEKLPEEEEEIKVDYHVIKVDNKPVLLESIDKLIHNLKNTNKSSQLTPPLQEEETILNIS